MSIEDYHPTTGIDPVDVATRRVAAAARSSQAHGMVLTARADAHPDGPADLDDTIRRLNAYCDAGADCVYAPGLLALDDITAVVDQVDAPVNVRALPGAPSIAALTDAGVRRISTSPTLISLPMEHSNSQHVRCSTSAGTPCRPEAVGLPAEGCQRRVTVEDQQAQ